MEKCHNVRHVHCHRRICRNKFCFVSNFLKRGNLKVNTRNFRFWRDSNAKSYKKLQHNFLRKIISNLLLEIKANFRGKKLKHFRMSLSRFFKFETRFRSTFERTFCHNIHNSFTWLAYVFYLKENVLLVKQETL